MKRNLYFTLLLFLLLPILTLAQTSILEESDAMAVEIEQQVIEWRRHFHEFPELSNREFNTGKKIA